MELTDELKDNKIKVLAVDNNPVLLKAISTILIQEGCDVSVAGTGIEALEHLEDNVPDILFADLIMPKVSGEQLCRVVRSSSKYKDVFIVILSAIVVEDKERILQEVDCDLCIAKGNLNEIRDHIREALHAYSNRNNGEVDVAETMARIPKGLKPSEVTEELLYEKLHNTKILSNLDEGILELTKGGQIVNVNRSACTILNQREELLMGEPLYSIREWGELQKDIERWVMEELDGEGMAPYYIYEDRPLYIEDKIVTASFCPVQENDSVFGLCILRDITRQFMAEKHNKELDDALKLAKKMDALSCMAGGMAHDFNNLLTVICGNLDIIAMDEAVADLGAIEKNIAQAQKAALIAVDLTRQISCFSNFGIVSRREVMLHTLVKLAVEQYFKNHYGEYSLQIEGEDLSIYVDSSEIATAMANIIQNGQEASGNSKIDIFVSKITLSKPELISGQYIPAGTYGNIRIVDYGTGIEGEDLFRVFDPYYSTKQRGVVKGMGLGLTIVYATLRNHGGHVVVCPGKETGTVVSLYLPVHIRESREEVGELDHKESKTILLIEPDQQMREIGSIMLSHLGYRVNSAANSPEAMLLLEQNRVGGKVSPDLIILDVSGVNKESPQECCRLFKQIVPGVHVVAMSGTILDPTMEQCQEYGFTNSLAKPYTMDGLKHVIGSALYT